MGHILKIIRILATFRRPRLALIAVIVAAFALSVALVPDASVEKFGYLIAMTIGVGFPDARRQGPYIRIWQFGGLADSAWFEHGVGGCLRHPGHRVRGQCP